jgi:preprotein translocase subunit SecF
MRILSRVPNIDFMGVRMPAVGLSALLTVLAILLIAFRGLNLGIDFTGGVLVEVSYPQAAPLDEVRAALARADFGRRPIRRRSAQRYSMPSARSS